MTAEDVAARCELPLDPAGSGEAQRERETGEAPGGPAPHLQAAAARGRELARKAPPLTARQVRAAAALLAVATP